MTVCHVWCYTPAIEHLVTVIDNKRRNPTQHDVTHHSSGPHVNLHTVPAVQQKQIEKTAVHTLRETGWSMTTVQRYFLKRSALSQLHMYVGLPCAKEHLWCDIGNGATNNREGLCYMHCSTKVTKFENFGSIRIDTELHTEQSARE